MFYKVYRRDPFFQFFEEDDEDDFFMDRLVNFACPFSSASPFGILTIGNSNCGKNSASCSKDPNANSLKRKGSCCSSNCHCENAEPAGNNGKEEGTEDQSKPQDDSFPPTKMTKFETTMRLDKNFKPGELKVKLSADNRSLVVEGRHEESHKSENGFSKVSSQVYRRVMLPKDVDVEGLKCDLNEEGVMVISAPRMLPALEDGKEGRSIPVNVADRREVEGVEGEKEEIADGEKTTEENSDKTV